MEVALLSANELTLTYGTQKLLEGVTVAVAPKEKVALVGRNGTGKTSLLKILAGANAPDSGEISRRRGLRVGVLPQEFELDPDATVLANIESGASDLVNALRCFENGEGTDAELEDYHHLIDVADGWNLEARIKASATALRVPPLDTIVGPLSGGEKRRVALCRALVGQPDLLLLDEPTNHLDAESIRWLEGYLGAFAGAVIFVTHDRYFLNVIATRIIELADGKAFSHPGNYTAYLEAKAIRAGIASQTERRRQRFIRSELEFVRAGVRAQRSKSRHRLASFYEVAGLETPPEEREMDFILPPPSELGNTVVELKSVGASVPDGGETRWLFRKFDLSLKAANCTGVVGPNGVGKTTLLKLCLGEREPDEGTVTIGKKVVFNYVDQSREQLDPTKNVLEQVADAGGETVTFGTQRISVRAYLRRFLFAEDRVRERIEKLSGGERARLLLAKILKRGGNVLVLDEPTNDLDLASLRILEEALSGFPGASLVVSHDRYFLDRICDQVVAFEPEGPVVSPGNYSYYAEKRAARAKAPQAADPAPVKAEAAPAPVQPAPTKPRKLGYKEQRELDGMEATILEAEAEVAELEKLLADSQFFVGNAHEAVAKTEELDHKKLVVTKLYARWAELGTT